MKARILGLILAVLLLASCGPKGPTINDTWEELTVLDNGYGDTLELALNTGRGNLSPIILEMQSYLKDFRMIAPSEDIPENVWKACERRFSLPIDAFILFLDADNYNENTVASKFDYANQALHKCVEWFAVNTTE